MKDTTYRAPLRSTPERAPKHTARNRDELLRARIRLYSDVAATQLRCLVDCQEGPESFRRLAAANVSIASALKDLATYHLNRS
jgi:hypothetical protein